MIDSHCHVVFGVDDGAQSRQMTALMLRTAIRQGVKTLICTSHTAPGYQDRDEKAYRKNLEAIQDYVRDSEINIRLLPGAEIMFTAKTIEMLNAGLLPTMADSNHILVEFQPDLPDTFLMRAVDEIVKTGYQLMVAHVERYSALRRPGMLEELRQRPVLIQVNADSVLSSGGLFGDKWLRSALKNGMVDVIASDAHNTDSRCCRLGDAYRFLKKEYGADTAKRLCITNPAQLLEF